VGKEVKSRILEEASSSEIKIFSLASKESLGDLLLRKNHTRKIIMVITIKKIIFI